VLVQAFYDHVLPPLEAKGSGHISCTVFPWASSGRNTVYF
jgi:hypothetical protein